MKMEAKKTTKQEIDNIIVIAVMTVFFMFFYGSGIYMISCGIYYMSEFKLFSWGSFAIGTFILGCAITMSIAMYNQRKMRLKNKNRRKN
jgi:hypothetical protein